jgi:hypothetical protein
MEYLPDSAAVPVHDAILPLACGSIRISPPKGVTSGLGYGLLKGIHMKYPTVFICWLFVLAGVAMAQSATGGVPTILEPKNGETVTSPVTIRVGRSDGSVTGADRSADSHGAHLHMIIDAPLPVAGKMIPMDSHHIHLMHGETQKTIPLAVGKHTIQLIEGSASHVAAADALRSDPVTFTVK